MKQHLTAIAALLISGLAAPTMSDDITSHADGLSRQVAQYTGQLIPIAGPARVGGTSAQDAAFEITETPHGPGFLVTTQKQPANHYDIEARIPLGQDVSQGDVLYASFWARARQGVRYETGEGFSLFRIQRNVKPWERSLYREIAIGPAWKQFYFGERFPADVPADQLAATFSAGYPEQAIEIAGLEVVNLGPDADPDALPKMQLDYLGAEPDAAWRQAALERIERHRMGDLTVRVVDAIGQPLPHVDVEIEMTRHAFDWGVAISAEWLDAHWETETADAYRGTLKQWFNSIAIENGLKWSRWEQDPSVAMRTLKWAKSQDLKMHGHVLVWPGLQKFRVADADEVWAAAQDDPQILRDRINNHIIDILTKTAGYVEIWDVVNEAYNQNELLNLLGREEFTAWFQLAERYAPDAVLMYNDFGLLGQSGTNRVKQDWVFTLLEEAIANDAPIDAVGFQAHLGSGYTPPARVLNILDRFATLGIDLQITEYDLTTTDPELAERYTKDFLIAVFSQPNVTAFQGWNYWSATPTWMPEAAYFDEQWKLLPVGKAFAAMVHDAWWTREVVRTDAQGQATLRGFLGDYVVRVQGVPESVEHQLVLSKEGSELEIQVVP